MDMLTAAQVADLLHLHVKHVQRLARAGRLPGTRVGRKWLFPRDRVVALLGAQVRPAVPFGLSARNQLHARVVSVTVDGLLAEVRLRIEGQELVAIISRNAAEHLALKPGVEVLAVIKSTEVIIVKP